ncbi:MAG: hypothetical protein ACUVTB_06415 [Candidatus Bathycorpusculaceae bacterium]
MDVIVKYEPQRWFYIGSATSTTTFLACITYLTYFYTKPKRLIQNFQKTRTFKAN